jgi:superfamily I DNA and RNA helicase
MINVIRGKSNKPASSKSLGNYFEKRNDLNGNLYIGYPIIGTPEGGYQVDALLITKENGVIIFNLVEGPDNNVNIEAIQDESFTKLQSKLLQHKDLTNKRELMVNLDVTTYAPAWHKRPDDIADGYEILIKDQDLHSFLESKKWQHNDYYEKLNSVIQAITTIRKGKKRTYIQKANSRGAKLKNLEESIANLDRTQNRAVIETVDGIQRIRGLAGSGKTIAMALKVAYLHATHPEWNIAVTFNTRALKGQFRHLINTFSLEHTNEEPDWEKVKVIHAWGSPKLGGIYYEFCMKHGIEYLDFSAAKRIEPKSGKQFDKVCEIALNKVNKFEEYYDAVLIDEAQDFSKDFLKLCYGILKEPKRLIYAYDELQNLSGKTMESAEDIFGVQLKNLPGEPKQDIILDICYRNSRPILSSAHALGFGIYREKGLVQMFEHAELWKDVGYIIEEGELKDGHRVKLSRTSETSPKFLEDHSPVDDLLMFKSFNNNDEQIDWLVNEIEKNLNEDELRNDDIMVIHANPLTTEQSVSKARELLFKKHINSQLAGISTTPDDFFDEKSIVFTGIYRAKGNEAALVYLINAQECFSGFDFELAKKRNILFTAMTRSKAWVRVIGYGPNMNGLVEEFNKVKSNNFSLDFTYPTEEQRKKMNIVSRDMSPQERAQLKEHYKSLKDLLEALKSGEMYKEDVPQDIIEELRRELL